MWYIEDTLLNAAWLLAIPPDQGSLLRPQLAGSRTVSISPARPCLVGGAGVGCPDLPGVLTWPRSWWGTKEAVTHWADETPHADLALVL